MSSPRDPESLLRELSDERVPLEPAEIVAARRERLIEAIGRGIRDVPRERERRTRRSRWFVAAAAAAVLALGVGAASHLRQPAVTVASATAGVAAVEDFSGTLVVTHSGRARVVAAGEKPALSVGDSVSTAADGSAKLRTARSSVEIAPATQLRVASVSPNEERLQLVIGRVELRVEPRADQRRVVVVQTPDSEVVVHGTVFSVAYDSQSGIGRTQVQVEEGAVSVRNGSQFAMLTHGQQWASGAKSAPVPAPEPVVIEAPKAESRAEPPSRSRLGSRKARAVEARDPSTLAEENRLFLLAVEARNRGDDRAAVELFAGMLAKYPTGKLAEEARIERMRALTRLGDSTKAAAEARRYLARHATGFAREEARSTALGSDPESRPTKKP